MKAECKWAHWQLKGLGQIWGNEREKKIGGVGPHGGIEFGGIVGRFPLSCAGGDDDEQRSFASCQCLKGQLIQRHHLQM